MARDGLVRGCVCRSWNGRVAEGADGDLRSLGDVVAGVGSGKLVLTAELVVAVGTTEGKEIKGAAGGEVATGT